jgi:hypothetical protein
MAAPVFVNASAGATDAGGAWAATGMAPGAAGRLIILHVLQDGTSAGQVTVTSGTNIENILGTDNLWTQIPGPAAGGAWPVGAASEAFQYIWVGRSLSTTAPTATGTNSGTSDLYFRMYQINGASASTSLARVIENVTRGVAANGVGTSAVAADTGVTTLGPERLVINLLAINDDNAVGAFTGQSGGTWAEPVAEYATQTGTDGCIQIQTATVNTAGTINGGTASITDSDAWGVVGFAILPTAPAVYSGATVTPFTFNRVVSGRAQIKGQVAVAETVGIVTVGRASARGIVSWAAVEIPKAHATVYGAVGDLRCSTSTICGPNTIIHGPYLWRVVTNGSISGANNAVSMAETISMVTDGRLSTSGGTVDVSISFNRAVSGNSGAQGLVSWGMLHTRWPGFYYATLSFEPHYGVVTAGRRTKVVGSVSLATSFAVYTVPLLNSDEYSGAPYGSGNYGDAGQEAAVSFGLVAGIVTNGVRKVLGAASLQVTETVVTQSRRIRYGAIVFPTTVTVATAAKRTILDQVAHTYAATFVVTGRVTARSSVVTPLTFGAVTRGSSGGVVIGNVVMAITDTISTSQRVKTASAVKTELQTDFHTASVHSRRGMVAFTATAGIVTVGRLRWYSAVVTPFTLNIQTASVNHIRRYGAVASPFTANIDTRGTTSHIRTGRLSADTTVNITTATRITHHAAVSLPITVTVVTGTRQKSFAASSLTLHWNFKTGNPIYQSGINGYIATGHWGHTHVVSGAGIRRKVFAET